ncbi:MAG: hypothetical protein Q8L14_17785 [Myxococcales bacterium]|nr:hypothetical protein [Myxococcales bacterium]
MNVLTIARQSFTTAWRHRALWLFGFFLAGSGGAGAGGPPRSSSGSGSLPEWLIPVILGAVFAGVGAFVMHIISEGALIAQVEQANGGVTPTVRSSFRSGLSHFGVVFRLKALAFVALLGLAVLVLVPVGLGIAALIPLPVGAALSGLVALVMMPAALTGFLLLEISLRVAVLEKRSALEALVEGKRYLSGRLLESLQLLVVAVVGLAGIGLVGVVALALGGVVGLIVYALTHAVLPSLVVGAVVAVPLLVPVIAFGGTYRSTVWTTGFLASRAIERG